MSTKKDLVIEGLEKLIELIEQSDDLREEVYFPIRDAMAQSGKLLEGQIKQNLTDNDSVVTGDLRGSVSSSEVQVTKEAIFVEVGAGRGDRRGRLLRPNDAKKNRAKILRWL